MTQELKPGEFVVNADGTVEGVLKFTKTSFKHSKEFLRESTWEVHEYVSHLIDNLGYTRVSTEGSAIKEEAPAFRIGGVYRQRNGALVSLRRAHDSFYKQCNWKEFELEAVMADGVQHGARRTTDGRCFPYEEAERDDSYDLLPGELIERDGQWVRAEEAKHASSFKGVVVTVGGGGFSATLSGGGGGGGIARKEPTHSPLPNSDAWRYTGKTFDRFAGFEVKSARAVDDPSYTMDEHASPLQRLNESTSHQLAKQGSAFLIED